MKYELLKDFSVWKKGEVYNLWDRIIVGTSPEELERIGIVKKVEEKKKPKFKVGDYAVCDNRFMKIMMVKVIGETFLYDWYLEKALRTPTKEELELYFR